MKTFTFKTKGRKQLDGKSPFQRRQITQAKRAWKKKLRERNELLMAYKAKQLQDYLKLGGWNTVKKKESSHAVPPNVSSTEANATTVSKSDKEDSVSESEIETQMFNVRSTFVTRSENTVPETQPFEPKMQTASDGVVSIPETECITGDDSPERFHGESG